MTDHTAIASDDVAKHSEATIVSMSPAKLLAQSEATRVEVSLRRDDAVHAAEERIERLRMELQDAERDLDWKRDAANTAHALVNTYADPLFERRVGDVILIDSPLGTEHTVIGIEVRPNTVVRYLTVPTRFADEAEGDGPRPAWRFAGEFRRP